MAYPIDPMKANYYPEIWGEAGSITTTTDGAEIAYYTNYGDRIIELQTLATHPESTGTGSIRVNTESGDDIIDSRTEARPYMNHAETLNIIGKTSIGLYAYYPSGGSAQTLYYRYTLRITKPTTYEKILHGINLTDTDHRLDEKYRISDKIKAGLLNTTPNPTRFDKIYEVAKKITASADDNPIIENEIHPLRGKKAVLLSVATEQHTTANQVYILVTRDRDEVMKLDTNAFINSVDSTYNDQLNYEQKLYVPATDKLKVSLENSVALTNFKVRFTYGIAPLTIVDKIRWGISLSSEERSLADEYDLNDAVLAGVM